MLMSLYKMSIKLSFARFTCWHSDFVYRRQNSYKVVADIASDDIASDDIAGFS
jgi:hypothetical protein